MLQESEHPGVFVGILRAGLGPFIEQAAALLAEGAGASDRVGARISTSPTLYFIPCNVLLCRAWGFVPAACAAPRPQQPVAKQTHACMCGWMMRHTVLCR